MSGFDEREERGGSFSGKVWAKLGPFLRPYRAKLIWLTVAMLATAAIDVALPLFQRYAIDRFILPGNTEGLAGYTWLYLCAIVLQAGLVYVFAQLAFAVEMRFGRDMKSALFAHLQVLSFSFYNTTPVGYILARTMSDTNRIATTVAWGLVDIFWALTYVLGTFVAMLLLNWRLALLIMLIVPLIAAATVYFQSRMLRANREMRRMNARITGAFNEGIGGARTSKTLVMEEHNSVEFASLTGGLYRSSVKSAMLSASFVPIVLFCGSLATAIVLARGGYLTMNGLLEYGTLAAFITYALSIFEPIQQIARLFADFISVQASIERVAGLLEKEPDVVDTPEVIGRYGDSLNPRRENWEPIRGDVEFEDVSFHYPDDTEYVLEHFNLKVPAGSVVAIVGETGAGKSTIVNLACRFFEPTAGRVLVDGRDYRERSQLWLHSSLGYVLQSPHLFSGTVRENIRYGRLEATDEEVEAAAKMVSADQVAARLERGYDTEVGEGGDRLSTGEKQLISFARAVLANPAIFVLDEATSSIDTQTEQLIQNAITRLLEGRTSFLIAHRLSTIRRADVILVVKEGRIVEQGSHRELMRKRGAYYALYTKQFEEETAQSCLG